MIVENLNMNAITSIITEAGGRVHRREITACIPRVNMCQGITQTTLTDSDSVKLVSFKLHDTKITCYIHYLGLDQDCKPNGSVTLTALLRLPKSKKDILNRQRWTVSLCVSAYEGCLKNSRLINNEPRSSTREVDDEDWLRLTMHMTVHDVIKQEAIVFSERRPDKIFFKIQAEINVND